MLNISEPAEIHLLNERLTQRIAAKAIEAGDTVLDLGANVGFHTKAFSQFVGPSGRVHAFEPNPELWPLFSSLANVRLWPFAVGDRLSVERFILPIGHDQVGSLVDARDFMGDVLVKVLTVAQVPVDYLTEATENPISFVKIDVERYELQALKGMVLTLTRHKPIIVFESNTSETQALLHDIGFDVFEMLCMTKTDTKLPNVVAIPREKASRKAEILPSDFDLNEILATMAA